MHILYFSYRVCLSCKPFWAQIINNAVMMFMFMDAILHQFFSPQTFQTHSRSPHSPWSDAIEPAVRVEVGHKSYFVSTSPPKHLRLHQWSSNIAHSSLSTAAQSYRWAICAILGVLSSKFVASCVPQPKVSFERRSWRGLRMTWTSPPRMPSRWNLISQLFQRLMLWWDQHKVVLVSKFQVRNTE